MKINELIKNPEVTRLEKVKKLAVNNEKSQEIWTEVKPEDSGVKYTFWVSMQKKYPYLVVNPLPGDWFLIDENCEVFDYGTTTRFPEIDEWIETHGDMVDGLLNGTLNQYRFYLNLESKILTEMANVPPEITGLPMVIYCSNNQHSSDVRIKVKEPQSSNYTTSIAVRSNKIEGKDLNTKVLEMIRKWIVLNYDIILDLWNGKINNTKEFLLKVRDVSGFDPQKNNDWDSHLKIVSEKSKLDRKNKKPK